MYNKILILFSVLVLLIGVNSCFKENDTRTRYAAQKECEQNLKLPYSTSVVSRNYFKSKINGDSLCLYDGYNNYKFTYSLGNTFTIKPGDTVNSGNTSGSKFLSFGFRPKNRDHFLPRFYLETELYNDNTTVIEILNDLESKKNLKIGKYSNHNGWVISWSERCPFPEGESSDPNIVGEDQVSAIFSTGINKYDQSGRFLRIKSYSKEIGHEYVKYDIEFELDVNIYDQKELFGRLTGVFKIHIKI